MKLLEAAIEAAKERRPCRYPCGPDGDVAGDVWLEVYGISGSEGGKTMIKAYQTIKTQTGCLTFGESELYFADEKRTRKQAFAALNLIRGEVYLVFLASKTDILPKNTRRIKSFVRPYIYEYRLRLDQTNLKDVGKIAANSLYYMRSLNKTDKPKIGEDRKLPKQIYTWSVSLNQADKATHKLVEEIINGIQDRMESVMFKTVWLYFGDGDASLKKAFAALDLKKHGLDLVFLAPKNSLLPKNARRVGGVVLPRHSECRLPINKTNLNTAIEIVARSRDYMRALDIINNST